MTLQKGKGEWFAEKSKEVPHNWREELPTILFGMKPETLRLLKKGPNSLAESWRLAELKKRYMEVKGIIPNPDDAWIEEERLRKEREAEEDKELQEIWNQFVEEYEQKSKCN